MTRKENVGRHGSTESSGAESWRSTDTVKGFGGRTRGTSVKVKTEKDSKAQQYVISRCLDSFWLGRIISLLQRDLLPKFQPLTIKLSRILEKELSEQTT